MDREKQESSQGQEHRSTGAGSNGKTWASCCGPEMFEADQMMSNCPCASMFRGSKRGFVVAFAVALLLFLTTATGWILGVVAFFRTF